MSRQLSTALAALAVLCVSPAASAQTTRHTTPNAVKYKDAGAKPATGRSGSATLEGRVLIAKDHTMTLEAATGSVDSPANPGTITKMQVKIGSDFTRNYNGLNAGGFWSAELPAATRGTNVQLQGNIKGIDPRRTGVVTISTPAVLRPDISVLAMSGPPEERPNAPVTFFATVKEINGDVGARADCVMSVDGAIAQTIPAVWVDAGGAVSCEFTHTFTEPGTYTVGASANGVAPGDWDGANNSASTTITVTTPDREISNGSLNVHQRTYDYRYEWQRSGGYYCDYYYYYCGGAYLDSRVEKISQLYLNGWNRGAAGPVAARLDARVLTNGDVADAVSLTPTRVYDYFDGSYRNNCASYSGAGHWDGSRYVYPGYYFQMCSNGDAQNGYTSYSFQRISGEVTYRSSRTECYSDGSCYTYDDYYYYWNDYRYGNGEDFGWKAGDNVGLQLAFVDAAGNQHTLDKTVTLQGSSSVNSWGPTTWFDYYYGHYTESYRELQTWAHAFLEWNEPQ